MKNWLLIVSLVIFPIVVFGQDYAYYEEDSVHAYIDGFYPTIESFKNNDPIRPEQLITTVKTIHPNFFKEVMAKPSFRYTENDTIKSAVVDGLFGYCKNGDPYLNMGKGEFAKMATVGTICFIPVRPTPTVQPSVGFGASSWGGAGVGMGVNITGGGPTEYIMHADLEKAAELSPESLMEFMADDPTLVEEFKALKRRHQRKEMYAFIQKYNERHPLQKP